MAYENLVKGGLEPYSTIVSDSHYRSILLTTLKISTITTIGALVLGYPVAYALIVTPPRARTVLLVAVTLPYWLDYIVRTYSWMILLGRQGIVNQALISIGLVNEPISLLYNLFSVSVGMIQVMLPLMVLTLYGGLVRIDRRLLSAAEIHGASPLRAFVTVFLPLSAPAVYGASLLVFVTSLGFYITPALLGGPSETMISQTIMSLAADLLDWPAASAASMVLLVVSTIPIAVYARLLTAEVQEGR